MAHSITDQLKREISDHYADRPFSVKDFVGLGSYDTIKRLLIRFEKEKQIIRIINGIYIKPKYSKLTNEVIPLTPHELALKISDNFSWKIIPSGNHALNLMGLSEQVPTNYEYLSTGPYREYHYNGTKIKFKNTKSNEINGLDYQSSLVVSAIRTLGKRNINDDVISKIRSQLSNKDCRILLNQTQKTTSWIYEVIKEVCA